LEQHSAEWLKESLKGMQMKIELKSRRRALLKCAIIVTLCVLGGATGLHAASRVRVATTTTMVTDMVNRIGGDRVQVTGLMGPGVDPHLYKPAVSDGLKLTKSAAIFYSGLMLEGRMSDLFARIGRRGKKVYPVTESIPQKRLLEPAEFEGHWDPHVWGDPLLWSHCVDTVVEGLSAADPAGKSYFARRGAEHKKELAKLHEWATKRIAEIPKSRRVLITSHDAFNYFGRAFGMEVVGVQGVSTVSPAGLADIAKTVDFIKKRGLKAIFIESSVSPAVIERISKDAGVKIGGELFSDACGTPGQIESGGGERYDVGTYIGMIKHNVNTVVDALK
jgi:manganese/zinc/iron transport system substrate-binding protein